jgi:exodeoxyribonuclease-3
MPQLRIVTWNINSLRLRLPLLARVVAALNPDVICLQETKVPDEAFPETAPASLGYPYYLRRGMKSYNGVAIFSRIPLQLLEDTPNWCDKSDCRHLAAVIATPTPVTVHNFYVPAGGDISDPVANPKFAHKLGFLDAATEYFAAQAPLTRTILVGDLNIAPLEHDVWSHKALRDVVSHTPIEVEKHLRWQNTGFVDAPRTLVPHDQKLYSWWSYRNQDWRISNRGRRLDHVWLTPDLTARSMQVFDAARDWTQTSDHAPLLVEVTV